MRSVLADRCDFPRLGGSPLIQATGKQNVAIEGAGTIRGNGRAYWDPDPVKTFVSRRPRPSPLIEFVGSRNVRIENVSIRDAAGWTIHPLESDGVTIHGVNIMNEAYGPNTDGIDVDSTRNVSISDTHIEASDDCIVLKTTGRGGGKVSPTASVTITNTVCSTENQGFKIGTESLGDFRDITFPMRRSFSRPGCIAHRPRPSRCQWLMALRLKTSSFPTS
jgi:polygalacturonase